jgi:hypothetical protein
MPAIAATWEEALSVQALADLAQAEPLPAQFHGSHGCRLGVALNRRGFRALKF